MIFLLFFGQVVSEAGDSIYRIGLLWLVLEMTGSSTLAGLMASAAYLPFLLFSLPAGSAADRLDRRRIMITADCARFFLVAAIPLLHWAGALTLPLLGLVTFLVASFQAFFFPARDSIIPSLCHPKELHRANTLIQTSWQLALLIGPALAAVLLAHTGTIHLFSADSITFLISAAAIYAIRPHRAGIAPQIKSEASPGMADGLRYILRDPLMRVVVLITVLDNVILMGPAIVGIPLFVRDVLHLQSAHYAWIEAALAGGALIGAPLMIQLGGRLPMGRLFVWGVVLDGLTYLPLFFIRTFPATIIAIVIHSIFIPMVTVSRTTMIQRSVPDHLRGRIFSLVTACVIGGTALSSILTGIVAEFVSMPWVYLGMALLAASTAAPGFFSEAIRRESAGEVYSAGSETAES